MLLVSALAFTDAVTQHANVIAAAKQADVRHVIYTAIQRVEGGDYDNTSVAEFVSARIKEGFPELTATFFAAWFQAIAAGEFA